QFDCPNPPPFQFCRAAYGPHGPLLSCWGMAAGDSQAHITRQGRLWKRPPRDSRADLLYKAPALDVIRRARTLQLTNNRPTIPTTSRQLREDRLTLFWTTTDARHSGGRRESCSEAATRRGRCWSCCAGDFRNTTGSMTLDTRFGTLMERTVTPTTTQSK